MSHLLGQFEQRPAERHVCCCHARLFEHDGDFRVRQTQLDARDDQGLVVGPQAIERGLVAIERLLADGQIQVQGSITFPLSDFAIQAPNIGGFIISIADEGTLEFVVLFDPA